MLSMPSFLLWAENSFTHQLSTLWPSTLLPKVVSTAKKRAWQCVRVSGVDIHTWGKTK